MSTDSKNPAPVSRKSRVITRGRPFEPGNPGRRVGARGKATVLLEQLFEGEVRLIGHKAIALAKDGNFGAVKLILDRACPPRRTRRLEGFALPALTTAEDAASAMSAIAAAVASGALAVEDARDMTEIVETFRRTRELGDIERRIQRLEKEIAQETGR